jgi:uncharacterized protein
MSFRVSDFLWDEGNEVKCQKHGLSIADIEYALSRDLQVFPDLKHSAKEQRFIGIGRTRKGRFVFIVFTLRKVGEQVWLRPISARYMHKKEISAYEKAHSEIQER